MTTTTTPPSTIPIPKLSANDWQLYSSMQGVGIAAHGMNRALHKAMVYLQKNLPPLHTRSAIHEVVGSAYRKFMEPAMDSYGKWGACDTEPRQEAQQRLSDAARKVLKMDKDELDFYDLW